MLTRRPQKCLSGAANFFLRKGRGGFKKIPVKRTAAQPGAARELQDVG